MQKKNLSRLLALALTLVMALALCAPALAAEEDEISVEEVEALLTELEEALAELEATVEEPAEYLWTKYNLVPLYTEKNNTLEPAVLLKADTIVKVVEYGETWTLVELYKWYNNLDGEGNQVQTFQFYVLSRHLTDNVPYGSFSYYHPYYPVAN